MFNIQRIDVKDKNAKNKFFTSFQNTGFAVIENHDISFDLIDNVYSEWEQFFNSEEKINYKFDTNSQDGFFPFKTENAKGQSLKDLKEFFHIYSWGRYPEELSNKTLDLYAQLLELTGTLLGWIQVETPRDVSSLFSMPLPDMVTDSKTNLLRIIHYPPIDGKEEDGAVRGSAHEDINLITLLVAGTQPGLQVQDTNGNWHDISCDPGCLAINAGDMLQEASHGYFPSTTHQVINPDDQIDNKSRFSMPLFLHPRDEVVLSKKYTAKEYLDERLREIGLKE